MKTTKRLSIFILVALMLITAFPLTSYAATHCTNNNNHSVRVGNTGKWFNSFDDVEAYVNGIQASWEKKYKNGEITEYEYKKIALQATVRQAVRIAVNVHVILIIMQCG